MKIKYPTSCLTKKWLLLICILIPNTVFSQQVDEIIGGNSPDDFSNFSNTVPDPAFTGDGSYSINLGKVIAGGGLDFPLVLTYSTGRLKMGASSGHVGLGWDLNIGEVVRSINCLPDEQGNDWFTSPVLNPRMDLGTLGLFSGRLGYTLEDNGTMNSGDVLSDLSEFDEWDNYNISTPYDSKKLIPVKKGNEADPYFLERPYSSWYVDYTKEISGSGSIQQFQMIDDNGRAFLFDKPHNIYVDLDGDGEKTSADYYSGGSGSDPFVFYTFPTTWKLTRIDHPYTNHYIKFIYDEYARVASGEEPFSKQISQYDTNLDLCGKSAYTHLDPTAHISYDESIIEKIETISHIIEFEFETDLSVSPGSVNGVSVERKRLKSISFKNKSSDDIYKVINFNYQLGESPRYQGPPKDVSLLKGVTFEDLTNDNNDQHYTFTYYTDINSDYTLSYYGFLGKYNHLDIITLPTGGTIDFDYEERRFSFYYVDVGSWNIQQRKAADTTGIGFLAGSRVKKITLDALDERNSSIIKNYTYGSAVRIESRFQDILTQQSFPVDYGYSHAKSIMSHVGHRWVEIKDSEGGFTKNYFTSGLSNYWLHLSICDNTTDCPESLSEEETKGIYFEGNTHHSGGQFLSNNSFIPNLAKIYDTYDEIYGKVYKSETGYYDVNDNHIVTQASESKWGLIESEYGYPSTNYSDVLNAQRSNFVYNYQNKDSTDGKNTYTYFANFFRSGACGENYDYRFRNDQLNFLGSPLNKVVLNSDYEDFYRGFSDFDAIINNPNAYEHLNSAYIERKYTFSEEFPNDVCWNNDLNTVVSGVTFRDESAYVLAGRTSDYSLLRNIYRQLIDFDPQHPVNTVGHPYPLVYVPYIQSSHENPFHSGWYTKWDAGVDGFHLPREKWVLESVGDAGVCEGGLAKNCDIDDYGRKFQTFDKYDTHGNIIQVSDAHGIKTSYVRSAEGTLLGIFKNAQLDEVFAHSFEYEGLEDWNIFNSDNADTEFSVEEGKLKLKNYGSASNNENDNISFTFPNTIGTNEPVVWEYDVKIDDSNGRDLTMSVGTNSWSAGQSNSASAFTVIENETWKYYKAGIYHTIASNLIIGKTYNFKMIIRNDYKVDFYLDGELKVSDAPFEGGSLGVGRIAFGNQGFGSSTTEWNIDNVRVYPADAQATTQELGANSRPLAIKGIDGTTERFEYDGHSRLRSYINKNGSFASTYNYNFTSTYNNITGDLSYSNLTPNNMEGRSFANSGPDDYLESRLDLIKFDSYPKVISFGDVGALDNPSAFSVSLWFKRIADHDGGYTGDSGSEATSHYINNVLIAQSSNSSNDNLEIGTKGSSIQVYLDTQSSDTYRTYNAGIVNEQWYHLALTYSSSADQAKLFLDGELVKTWTEWGGSLDNSASSPLSLGMARPNDQQWGAFEGEMSNARVYGYALTDSEVRQLSLGTRGVSYFDGIGRPIQSHSIGTGENIVSGQLYDSRGLQEVKSRPSSVPSNGYITDFFGSTFTSGSTLSPDSPIKEYWDDQSGINTNDANFAYNYVEHEDSRTNRVLKSTLPGYEHRSGNGNEINNSYELNGVSISTPNRTWAPNTLYKTISEDPEGKKSVSYSNFLGRVVASGNDMDGNGELGGTSDLTTTFEYDYNGNVVLVEDPRMLQTTYIYNAQSELIEKKLSDQDHPNKYCYDDKGRIRFHADPNDFANPYTYYSTDHYSYTYSKYDDFNRLVEIGEQDASFVGQNSEASYNIICETSALLNNQDTPSANTNPRIYYSYDGENSFQNAKNTEGKVSRIQYADPNNGSNWGYTWYSYDHMGLVEWIKQRLPGRTSYDDRTISYAYDDIGRVTKISYDEGYSSTNDHYFWYYYDELGRLEKVTSYGSNAETSALTEAEYTYYADGQVEELVLGGGAQTLDYDYTIQGWLEDINNGAASNGDTFGMVLDYNLNGNISQQQWSQAAFSTGTYNYYYDYDSANRLKEACYDGITCSSTGDYDVTYSYDKNGNISNISRNGAGSNPDYDYAFNFVSGTNKINSVWVDGISGETQAVQKQFNYDASGNVTQNEVQGVASNGVGITNVTYDWRNLPTLMSANGSTLTYTYDADGNRVKKKIGNIETWYVRGADGQTIAAYQGSTLLYLNILAGGQIIGQIQN